jgi:hypothetical protein
MGRAALAAPCLLLLSFAQVANARQKLKVTAIDNHLMSLSPI